MNKYLAASFLLWTFFLLSIGSTFAKQSEHMSNNIETIDSLQLLLRSLQNANDYEKVYSTIETINRLTEDAKNNILPANTFYNIAIAMERIPDYELSLKYLDKAIEQAKENEDQSSFLRYRGRKAYILVQLSKNEESIEIVFENLRLLEEMKDPITHEHIYLYSAFVYKFIGNVDKTESYLLQALSVSDSTNKESYYHAIINELGNLKIAKGEFEEGVRLLKTAMQIRIANNDHENIIFSYHDIALAYLENGQCSKAFVYAKKAIEVLKFSNDSFSWSSLYFILAKISFCLQRDVEGLAYIDSSNSLAMQNSSYSTIASNFSLLSAYYESTGNLQKALENTRLSHQYSDTMTSTQTNKQIMMLNARFELEKKNKLLARNDLQIQRQRALLQIFVIVFIIVLSFAIWVLLLQRRLKKINSILQDTNQLIEKQKREIERNRDEIKQKAVNLESINRILVEKNAEIEAQSEEIASQRDIVISQKEAIENINKSLTDNIQYAKNIQQAMLPPKELFKQCFSDFFIFYQPRDIVSGDFYWLHKTDKKVILSVADCTGHGVSGAFMSILGITLLNEIVKVKGVDAPELILEELRRQIIGSLHQTASIGSRKDGIEISVVTFDFETSTMTFAGANLHCWIIRANGDLEEISGNKCPASVYPKMMPFTSHSAPLQVEDTLFLHTDGFQDQFNHEQTRKFQSKQLKSLISSNYYLPLPQQEQVLAKSLYQWKQGTQQTDDITIVAVRLKS